MAQWKVKKKTKTKQKTEKVRKKFYCTDDSMKKENTGKCFLKQNKTKNKPKKQKTIIPFRKRDENRYN